MVVKNRNEKIWARKTCLSIYLSDVRFLFKAILQFSHLSEATIKELAQPFSQN